MKGTISITVNTPTHEYEHESLRVNSSIEIDMLNLIIDSQRKYPDWNSMVVILTNARSNSGV